jgi:hypothetical protein
VSILARRSQRDTDLDRLANEPMKMLPDDRERPLDAVDANTQGSRPRGDAGKPFAGLDRTGRAGRGLERYRQAFIREWGREPTEIQLENFIAERT